MIVTNVVSRGAAVTSSLSGNLSINEDNGEIVIRNGSQEVVRIDKSGFKYFDANAVRRIAMGQNSNGQQQIIVYDANGKAQIIMGQDPSDSKPIIAVGKEGVDVIAELTS